MPYRGERASKGGHSDIVRNPDVGAFLSACEYLKEPSDEEGAAVAGSYVPAPACADDLPRKVVASDASPYSEPISGRFPSTQIGYVKVSLVMVDVDCFQALSPPGARFVDPTKVAEMHRNAQGIAFTLPGSNVRYKGARSVRAGFRQAVFDQYCDQRSNFDPRGDYRLIDTLLVLGREHPLIRCPDCGHAPSEPLLFSAAKRIDECARCGTAIYATDLLRLHEPISDFGDNSPAITRFMNVTEHLLVASFVRMLADNVPDVLSQMGFVLDGPLAIFGQPAWIHRPLMRLYHDVATRLAARGCAPPVILGLQKEGHVMDHARAISRFLKPSVFRIVDDQYRERWVTASPSLAENFGTETYYGQDFIFKTAHGGVFVVGVPYPFSDKGSPAEFAISKVEIARYGASLCRALEIVRHFEFDLYENSIIPVALAHRHASISLVPGGQVLDLVSRHGLGAGS